MFKLINFFEMPHLNQLRYEMGASIAKKFRATMEISLLDETAIRMLGIDGIEISSIEEITPQNDKTLGYKGQRVLVYIRDVNHYRNGKNQHLPKFHVSFCKKLEEMRNGGRWQRYVVANRDDGFFSIRINNSDPEWLKLNVCQYCLETLSWSGFSRHNMQNHQKKTIVSNFIIAEFFDKFPKSLFSIKPTHTSDTAPINDYSDDWPEVSENLKRERDYHCDSPTCKIRLVGNDKKFLHVHHINGLKNDNSKANLQVLCIRCHAEEPYHAHVKSGIYYKEFIARFEK